MRGVRPRHRPVVAAADDVVVVRRPEADRRAEEREGAGPGGEAPAPRPPRAAPAAGRRPPAPAPPACGIGVALDRRVPLGAHGGEEVERAPAGASPASGRARTPAHGCRPCRSRYMARAHRSESSSPPGRGLRAQRPGTRRAGPRARRGPRSRPRCRRRAGPARPPAAPRRRAGRRARSRRTRASRSISSAGRADERGELAGGAAPQEVHLEEALLRVQEAGGARHVEAARRRARPAPRARRARCAPARRGRRPRARPRAAGRLARSRAWR